MCNNINSATCKKCYLCIEVCPAKCIGKNENKEIYFIEERLHICLECGQCMAVCETKSIVVGPLTYKDNFVELLENTVTSDAFYNFLASRRSVRNFRDKPVPQEIIQKIIDFVNLAPYGSYAQSFDITVIPDREKIDKMLPLVSQFLNNIPGWMKNPMYNFIMKKKLSEEKYETIMKHLLPIVKTGQYSLEHKPDRITRGAQAVMIFHADKKSEEHTDDTLIAVTYAAMAAHALGLGAFIGGLIPPAVNKDQKIREMLNIPEEHEAVTSLMLGYPKYRYQRGIKHPGKKVNWVN